VVTVGDAKAGVLNAATITDAHRKLALRDDM
jgi:hypothetical protein